MEVITPEQEAVPAETPAALPTDAPIGSAPASTDSWESVQQLLDEYDSKVVGDPPPTEPAPDNTEPLSNEELNKFINEVSGPSADQQKITALESEIGSLRTAELQRQSKEDFEKFSSHLQGQLGPNVDSEFACTNLLAMVAQRPELEIAWSYRNLTNEQLRAADAEFRQLEALYFRLQHTPNNDPRKAEAMAQMYRRGQELGLMMNARTMIANARRDERAESFKPIDVEATEDRAAIIASVIHDGLGPRDIPSPPVQWGRLSGREFRERVQKEFGFDPGTGW